MTRKLTADDRAFQRAIDEAPLDVAPWHVYADWLDEHHLPDEAAAARAWTREKLESRAYLVGFCVRLRDFDDDPLPEAELRVRGIDPTKKEAFGDADDPQYWRNWYGQSGPPAISYDELVALLTAHAEDPANAHNKCFNFVHSVDSDDMREAWRHFQVITGLKPPAEESYGRPDETYPVTPFRCSC